MMNKLQDKMVICSTCDLMSQLFVCIRLDLKYFKILSSLNQYICIDASNYLYEVKK